MKFSQILVPFLVVANDVAAREDAVISKASSDRLGLSKRRSTARNLKKGKKNKASKKDAKYEIWASDQSNSVPGQSGLGLKGSFLWIFNSDSVNDQIAGRGDAIPIPCSPNKTKGPCDAFDIFSSDLVQVGADGPTGNVLGDLPGFGRLHGVLPDPQHKYVNANFFTPGGAFIGIIDVATKEAIALFRASEFTTSKKRSIHMSTWSHDGSAIFIANLHGKAIERINIERDPEGYIISAAFDQSSSIALGKDNKIVEEATFFRGNNALGKPLIGTVIGNKSNANLGDLTPNGFCREDGCTDDSSMDTGRVNNVPICPITSSGGFVYVNFGGGGLLVLDGASTPLSIVGEYDTKTFNGAGCGGIQVDKQVFMNAGVSAGGAGFDQSTFSLYSFDDTTYSSVPNAPNDPPPTIVFKDPTNTNTIGNVDGVDTPNETGQIPGQTTRRDSHGSIDTLNDKYLHVFDRIQNIVEVFDVNTYDRYTYDLTSKNGQAGRPEDPSKAGACLAKSVTDDPSLIGNDPTPDLVAATPDGKYLVVGLRGPVPVSVGHSGQGSCPGVGIIKLTKGGKAGKLVDVIRTTNTIDTAPVPTITGGIQYSGAERSDIHAATIVNL